MSERVAHRRRRRRRHLHRPVPVRRGDRQLPHRQGAVEPRRRGGRLHERPARARRRRGDSASIVHGTTVGTNALLERKGARIGVITTRGLPRRAGDAPPRPAARPGACGATSRRSSTATCASRSPSARSPTARSARRSTSRRCSAGARRCWRAAREALRHRLHQRLRQPRQRARRAAPPLRAVWPNAARRRLARDPARDPRVRARLDHRAQRLSAAGRRRLPRQARRRAGRSRLRRRSSTSCSRTAA